MHKKTTENRHIQIANDTMYYIYKYIDTDINIDELALKFKISKIHFHTIFKKQMGKNIYETIKSIRLQKASNLLLTNSSSTITQIANMCGYSSQTSFIRAFKQRFHQTPTKWRNGGFKEYSKEILSNSKIQHDKPHHFASIEPRIVKTKDHKAYYIRQLGYEISQIKKTWQKLKAWIYTNNIKEYEQAGLYHDNPLITPLDEAFYIGAIVLKKNYNLPNTNLPHFKISGGLYAVFSITGVHGDIVRFMQWAYQDWLPKSGFETITKPAFTIFKENHYLNESGMFEADFYLPIAYN
jgi:AraC family transcriptional regulator